MKRTPFLLPLVTAVLAVCGSASAQTSPPPMNLTRYMPVTASSNADSLGGNPKYAVDGLVCEESRWISDPVNTAHWFEVDLGGSFQIGSANIITGNWDTSAVANFSLQYWTGSAWVNIPGAAITGNTKTQRQIVFSSPVTASKVRFYSDDDGSIAVKELAVFPPKSDGTAYPIGTEIDIRSGMLPKITSSSQNDTGQRPYLAYDGFAADASRWISANVTTQHWLEYGFIYDREIAYAHIYTGLGNGSAVANFRLQSWDATASAWVNIPGGSVTGNTQSEVFLTFTSTVRTSRVRLVSDDDGNIRVKEMVLLPPNGGVGYPRGTGVTFAPPPGQQWKDFSDNFYTLKNRVAGLNLRTAPDGRVSIETADSSSFAQQYHILLNIGTDTYRICNRANQHCLEVAGGSLSPGAVVQEGDYNARPYQQWRLAAAGSYVKLVNVYSGLLLTVNGTGSVAGTGVIQQIDTSSNAQQWSLPYVTHFPKKGSSRSEVWGDFVARYNASHWYGWGLTPSIGGASSSNDPTHFVPQLWNLRIDRIADMSMRRSEWAVSDVPKYLMAYNEPNHTDQANVSVQDGLDNWSRLEQVNLPLVGPQHDYAWGSWYTSFFDQADAKGFRIDEGGGHIYPTASSVNYDAFNSGVTDGYNAQNGRVQWVTEWNWVNWGGAATWTDDELYSVVAETLWRYENNPWVKRYEFFSFNYYWANGRPGALERDGNILPLGRLYSAWDGDLNFRPNTWYIIHNRGTHAQLQNSSGAPVNTTIDTVNTTVNWYLVAASSGKYYIVSRDGTRLSSNGTAVTLAAAGTTGTAVEWALTPVAAPPGHYGWYYLDHPASGKRLDSPGTSGALAMSTATDNSPRWRFIKPYQPGSITVAWGNPAGGVWSTNSNWNGGAMPPDGLGSTADFGTLDITADRTITLDSSRNIGALRFGDTSGTQNWTLASSGGSTLTLDTGSSAVPTISVNQNSLTISAPIAGENGLTQIGSNSGLLSLTGTNTFTGDVTIGNGSLRITNSGGLGTGTKAINVNNGTGGNTQLHLDGTSGSIALPAAFTYNTSNNDGAIFNDAGNNSIAGQINMTAGGGNTVIQSDAGTLTISANITAATTARSLILQGAGNGTVSGVISDGATTNLPVIKNGAGTWTLSGDNTYTGATTVNAGALLINGSNAASTTTVASGATIGGGGTAGAVTVQSGGTLAPGGTTALGTFAVGNATLSGTLAIGIASTGSADRLDASGSVTLGGPLAVTAPAGLPAGTAFTILNKTSAGAASGTFAGLPQNSMFTTSGNTWIISYSGGDGNDVVVSIPTQQQSWQYANFGANWNNPAIAGDAVDPDGDGVSNLLERAFGGKPTTSDANLLPATDPAAPMLSIDYWKSKDATDLTFTVLESPDLSPGSWVTSSGTNSVLSETATAQRIRFTTPAGAGTRKFLRLQVAKP